MLQQILKEMYIDPDVLEALNEDQKKTLFLKMRQEQVRRWTEREEQEATAAQPIRTKPKTANSKKVSWLLGRDGDVAVVVIEEVGELTSSRVISPGLGERKTPSLRSNTCLQTSSMKSNLVHRVTPESCRAGRENLPPRQHHTGVQLHLKESAEAVKSLPPLQVVEGAALLNVEAKSAVDVEPNFPQENKQNEGEKKPSFIYYKPHIKVVHAALRHVIPPTGSSACPLPTQDPSSYSSNSPSSFSSQPLTSSPALALARALATSSSSCPNTSPVKAQTTSPLSIITPGSAYLSGPALSSSTLVPVSHPSGSAYNATATKTAVTPDHTPPPAQPSVTSRLRPQETLPAESQGSRDKHVVTTSQRAMSVKLGSEADVAPSTGRGRVARLMKTFSVQATTPAEQVTPARGNKPPVPTKPSHLRLISTPSLS